MSKHAEFLEYLLAAIRVPLKSDDPGTRRVAAGYELKFSAELRKLGQPRKKPVRKAPRSPGAE